MAAFSPCMITGYRINRHVSLGALGMFHPQANRATRLEGLARRDGVLTVLLVARVAMCVTALAPWPLQAPLAGERAGPVEGIVLFFGVAAVMAEVLGLRRISALTLILALPVMKAPEADKAEDAEADDTRGLSSLRRARRATIGPNPVSVSAFLVLVLAFMAWTALILLIIMGTQSEAPDALLFVLALCTLTGLLWQLVVAVMTFGDSKQD